MRAPAMPNGNGRCHDGNHEAGPAPDRLAGQVTDGDGGTADPAENGPGGRDARGRFAKGNPGGPGNPFARRVAALRRALLEAVSEDDLELVARRLVAQAVEGDVAAARLVLAYTLGKPAEPVDPDTLDQQEWQLYRQRPVNGQDLLTVLGNVPVDLALTLLRACLPALSRDMARLAAQVFTPAEPKPARRRKARPQPEPAEAAAPEHAAQAAEGPKEPDRPGTADGPAPGRTAESDVPQAEATPTGERHADRGAAPRAAGRARRRKTTPAAAGPVNLQDLHDQDTELLRRLQALLGDPQAGPPANGDNGEPGAAKDKPPADANGDNGAPNGSRAGGQVLYQPDA